MAERITTAYDNRPINRAEMIDATIETSTDTNQSILSVDLEAIDGAIMYYFDKVMIPTVEENSVAIKVPIIYGSQERWKSVQQDGFFRDNKGRIMTPLIMFKRTNVAKNPEIPVDKMDANNPQLFQVIQKRYTKKNQFDQFSVLTNQVPN